MHRGGDRVRRWKPETTGPGPVIMCWFSTNSPNPLRAQSFFLGVCLMVAGQAWLNSLCILYIPVFPEGRTRWWMEESRPGNSSLHPPPTPTPASYSFSSGSSSPSHPENLLHWKETIFLHVIPNIPALLFCWRDFVYLETDSDSSSAFLLHTLCFDRHHQNMLGGFPGNHKMLSNPYIFYRSSWISHLFGGGGELTVFKHNHWWHSYWHHIRALGNPFLLRGTTLSF